LADGLEDDDWQQSKAVVFLKTQNTTAVLDKTAGAVVMGWSLPGAK
jgi:hypothetical protein